MRTPIKQLHADCLYSTPVNFDWSEGDGWNCYEAVRCEKCKQVVVLDEGGLGGKHRELATAEDKGTACDGYVPYAEGPMMNYYYPMPKFNQDHSTIWEAVKLLVDLPLCIVNFSEDDSVALALTGGGMDFSWEICEAFMLLGQLPPLHFRLPQMSDRGESAKDKWIISGCRGSIKVAKCRLVQNEEYLKMFNTVV